MGTTGNANYQYLRESIEQIPALSCHDHLIPERVAVGGKIDLFDTLFHALVWADVVSAGYPGLASDGSFGPISRKPRDAEAAWAQVKPWLDNLRDTAVFQVRLRALRELFGFDEELDDSNWRALNEKIISAQEPGWYFEVLRKRGNLEASLDDVIFAYPWTQNDPADRFYCVNVVQVMHWTKLTADFRKTAGQGGSPLGNLDQAVEALRAYVDRMVTDGVIALKMPHAYHRSLQFDDVPREVAVAEFPRPDDPNPAPKTVQDYMAGEICRLAAQYGVTVPFHTGYQYGNGNDIRNARAQHLLSLIQRHPETRFDLFHLGYPYCEETMMLAKYFPNVTFNMNFGIHLSPRKVVELLHVAIELLPANKILVYGCDEFTLEAHYGATCIWRDCIARCLAERIDGGALSRPRALRLMQKFVRDNAAEFYRYDAWRAKHPVG